MSFRSPVPFRVASLALVGLVAAGCSSWGVGYAGKPAPVPSSDHLPVVSEPRAIVRMQPDGALEITTLVSRRGSTVPALRIVAPGDPAYDRILALTGPLVPGQQAAGYLPAQ
jgi:hypothetical protein